MIKAVWQAAMGAKTNYLSVSLQDIYPHCGLPPLYSRSSSLRRLTETRSCRAQTGVLSTPPNFSHLVQRCHWALSLHLLNPWRRWQRLFLCVSGGRRGLDNSLQPPWFKTSPTIYLFIFLNKLLPCQISQQMRASESGWWKLGPHKRARRTWFGNGRIGPP